MRGDVGIREPQTPCGEYDSKKLQALNQQKIQKKPLS